MNKNKRGEIITILTIATLVFISATALISSVFLKQKKTNNSKAAGNDYNCSLIPSLSFGSDNTCLGDYGEKINCGECNYTYKKRCVGPGYNHNGRDYVSYASDSTCVSGGEGGSSSASPTDEPSVSYWNTIKECSKETNCPSPGKCNRVTDSYDPHFRQFRCVTTTTSTGTDTSTPTMEPFSQGTGGCGSGGRFDCDSSKGYNPSVCPSENLGFNCCVKDNHGPNGSDRYRWYGCIGTYCSDVRIHNSVGHLVSCPSGINSDNPYPDGYLGTPTLIDEETPTPTLTQNNKKVTVGVSIKGEVGKGDYSVDISGTHTGSSFESLIIRNEGGSAAYDFYRTILIQDIDDGLKIVINSPESNSLNCQGDGGTTNYQDNGCTVTFNSLNDGETIIVNVFKGLGGGAGNTPTLPADDTPTPTMPTNTPIRNTGTCIETKRRTITWDNNDCSYTTNAGSSLEVSISKNIHTGQKSDCRLYRQRDKSGYCRYQCFIRDISMECKGGAKDFNNGTYLHIVNSSATNLTVSSLFVSHGNFNKTFSSEDLGLDGVILEENMSGSNLENEITINLDDLGEKDFSCTSLLSTKKIGVMVAVSDSQGNNHYSFPLVKEGCAGGFNLLINITSSLLQDNQNN